MGFQGPGHVEPTCLSPLWNWGLGKEGREGSYHAISSPEEAGSLISRPEKQNHPLWWGDSLEEYL